MGVLEALRIALLGLSANKLRTALTMFGILIGVAAVILLVALGNGTSAAISKQIQGLGSNSIAIFPKDNRGGGASQGFGTGQTLTEQDVTALSDKTNGPDIAAAMPVVTGRGVATYQNQNWPTSVVASTADYARVGTNSEMQVGGYFGESDVRTSAKVAVVGQTIVDHLFGGDPSAALGSTIKVQRQSFLIVGVKAVKGAGIFGNPDDEVDIPVTTGWDYILGGRGKNINLILVLANNADAVPAAKDESNQIMMTSHRVTDPALANFQVESQQDLLQQVGQVTGLLTVLLGAIAAISLIVGGIGIMNIMLVTVTERTREIGIRKAIGAKRADILLQFLIESMFLAGVGGIIGIVVGIGLSDLAGAAAASAGGAFPAPVVSIPSVLLAFGVSVGIGLFFGIYPANRAAGLRPIEALRYE